VPSFVEREIINGTKYNPESQQNENCNPESEQNKPKSQNRRSPNIGLRQGLTTERVTQNHKSAFAFVPQANKLKLTTERLTDREA